MLMNRQEALKIAKDLDQKKLEKSVAAMFGRLEKHVGMSESKVRENYRIRSLCFLNFLNRGYRLSLKFGVFLRIEW